MELAGGTRLPQEDVPWVSASQAKMHYRRAASHAKPTVLALSMHTIVARQETNTNWVCLKAGSQKTDGRGRREKAVQDMHVTLGSCNAHPRIPSGHRQEFEDCTSQKGS